jgi:hypothetical protein
MFSDHFYILDFLRQTCVFYVVIYSLKCLIFGLFYVHPTTHFDLQRPSSVDLWIYVVCRYWSIKIDKNTNFDNSVTTYILKNPVFWDVSPCRSCGNGRFGGTYRFHLQDRNCSHLPTLIPRSRIFLLWRWRRYVPPKRRFTQDLYGTTS